MEYIATHSALSNSTLNKYHSIRVDDFTFFFLGYYAIILKEMIKIFTLVIKEFKNILKHPDKKLLLRYWLYLWDLFRKFKVYFRVLNQIFCRSEIFTVS